jgi:hypothetical protein
MNGVLGFLKDFELNNTQKERLGKLELQALTGNLFDCFVIAMQQWQKLLLLSPHPGRNVL